MFPTSVEHVDCVPQPKETVSEYNDICRCVSYFNNVHVDNYMALLLDSAHFELQVRGG